MTLNNLGQLHKEQEEYPKAIECLLKCLEIKDRLDEKGKIHLVTTLVNLGDVYHRMENYPKSIDYFLQCEEIQEKTDPEPNSAKAMVYRYLGNSYFKL